MAKEVLKYNVPHAESKLQSNIIERTVSKMKEQETKSIHKKTHSNHRIPSRNKQPSKTFIK